MAVLPIIFTLGKGDVDLWGLLLPPGDVDLWGLLLRLGGCRPLGSLAPAGPARMGDLWGRWLGSLAQGRWLRLGPWRPLGALVWGLVVWGRWFFTEILTE